jgi:hypothetical protein
MDVGSCERFVSLYFVYLHMNNPHSVLHPRDTSTTIVPVWAAHTRVVPSSSHIDTPLALLAAPTRFDIHHVHSTTDSATHVTTIIISSQVMLMCTALSPRSALAIDRCTDYDSSNAQ